MHQFQPAVQYARQGVRGRHRFDARAMADQVAVPVRKRDEIAGDKRHPGAIFHVDSGAAFAEQVVDDDMSGSSVEQRRQRA